MVRFTKGGKLCLSAKPKKRKTDNLKRWRLSQKENVTPNLEHAAGTSKVLIKDSNAEIDNVSNTEFENTVMEYNDIETENTVGNPHVSENTQSTHEGMIKDKKHLISGYRIIKFEYFFKALQDISTHPPFGCGLADMVIETEKQLGLTSCFKLRCKFCNIAKYIYTDVVDNDQMNINMCAVSASNAAGVGFSGLEEIINGIDMPCMSHQTFIECQTKLHRIWTMELEHEISENAKIAADAARQRGDVDKDNIPLLTVVADGTWGKRSFGRHFSSLSGAAAIIDYHTKKLLHLGVLNKYCLICSVATNNGRIPKKHICYKNYTGSSSSMEASIVVEGFRQSEELHDIRYATLVADGDSSVYSKILESRPYIDLTVEKIECTNHLLRNYCKKLSDLCTNTKYPVSQRKVIKENIMRLRSAVTKAVQFRKTQNYDLKEKTQNLKRDLLNSPFHVFGEHESCDRYFCKGPKENEKKVLEDFRQSGVLSQILSFVSYLANHSNSLMHQKTNNLVEHFNSRITKKVGGKRTNLFHRTLYSTRVALAAIDYNTDGHVQSRTRELKNNSYSEHVLKLERKRQRKIALAKDKRQQRNRYRYHRKAQSTIEDKDYGPSCTKPDMPPEVFARKKEEFLQNLIVTQEDQLSIMEETVDQSQSVKWKELRRKRIGASMFGRICGRKPYTSCEKIVSAMLYKTSELRTPSIMWGKTNEKNAIVALEKELDKNVQRNGLFIDINKPFLCATPDGLIDDDCVLEVKCPYAARDMTPDEGIFDKLIPCYKKNKKGEVSMNKNHAYYYQMQGQMLITKRSKCIFVIWTTKGLKIDTIVYDETFCKNMVEKLETFYYNCLLPELVDPRRRRELAIRNPDYILKAQRERNSKKKLQNQNT